MEISLEGFKIPVGMSLLGRVIDSNGQACDGGPEIIPEKYYPIIADCPDPYKRLPITNRYQTGVRAVDSLFTIGKGQRIGVYAGAGVGKTVLLSMIARYNDADINVIGLIGKRWPQVSDFINVFLGKETLKRSVIVVATSEQPSICRLRAGYVCTAIAEYFRDRGKDVTFILDSITRFAHAQREIGLSNGEEPSEGIYPPSVFDLIPELLARTGTNDIGTITAFYTILAEYNEENNQFLNMVMSFLEGNILLSHRLAHKGHFPAINILRSYNRLTKLVSGKQTQEAGNLVRKLIKKYEDNETIINSVFYQKGVSSEIDFVIEKHSEIENFLQQEEHEYSSFKDTLNKLSELIGKEIPDEEYEEIPDESDLHYILENNS